MREGFRSIEHVKRYTTTGMATDQGKTSNMNALAIAAKATRQADARRSASPPSARPIRRSPSGCSPATSRGDLFDPGAQDADRTTGRGAAGRRLRGCRPVEARLVFSARRRGHARRGRPRMPDGARARRHVRRLDARQDRGGRPRRRRVHEPASTPTPGHEARAGPLPLRPDAQRRRLRLWTTASSAAWRRIASTSPPRPAARRACSRHMEDYLQTEWPDLKVWLTSTTEQWAVIAVQGPQARATCSRRWSRASTSPARRLPHMACTKAASAACRRGCSA